jgi:hypothetical protein
MVTETNHFEQLPRTCARLRASDAGDFGSKRNIIHNGKSIDEPRILENQAEFATKRCEAVSIETIEITAIHDPAAAVESFVAEENSEESRFARSGGTGDEYELTRCNVQRDIAKGEPVFTEALRNLI